MTSHIEYKADPSTPQQAGQSSQDDSPNTFFLRTPEMQVASIVPEAYDSQSQFGYAPGSQTVTTDSLQYPSHVAPGDVFQFHGVAPVAHPVVVDVTGHLAPKTNVAPLSSTSTTRVPSGSTVPDPESIEELGRTFHGYKEGKYFLPNDGAEQDRLDLQHAQWDLMLEGDLYWAPITSPKNVLDIGTGTGIWAIQFAEKHPESNVIGTDLSQIQPQFAAPGNCRFIREDAEDQWTTDMKFDYAHLRLMLTCFNDHKSVIQKIFEHMEPGGWVEYQDGTFEHDADDGSMRGTALQKWIYLLKAGGTALGRDFDVARFYKSWLIEAGFVDVVDKPVMCPGNTWPTDPRMKEIGRWALVNALELAEPLSLKVLQHGLGMTISSIQSLVADAKKDMKNKRIKWYGKCRVVYGRKPFPGEILRTPK